MARRWCRWLPALLAGLGLAGNAWAHRVPESLTTVEYNPQSGSTEIIHRMHRHDAELAMAALMEQPGVSLEELAVRARLALYVEAHFAIAPWVNGEPGEPLALKLVGAQLEGDHVLVFQEWPGRLPGSVALRDDILRDRFPGQVNKVNITTEQGVRTLDFRGDARWVEIR